jgi:hypothetical protein
MESLPSKKNDHQKKGQQGLKTKRGETSVEKICVLRREKKKRMRSTCYWKRFY